MTELPRFTRGPILDAGAGVKFRLVHADGEFEAVEWWHDCGGRPPLENGDSITVKPYWRDGWDVISVEPLTLSPSILCTACKLHGYLRNGKWVSA